MKIKNVKLEWYVLRWNSSLHRVENYNILYDIIEDLHREVKAKRVYNKSILREYLKTELMYRYWSKSECEMAVGGLFSTYPDEFKKIDMWRQIEPNLNNIVEYVNTKCNLKFE